MNPTVHGLVLAGSDSDKAEPLGLLVLVLLALACYFLFKSMSRHLRKVRESQWAKEQPVDGARPTSSNHLQRMREVQRSMQEPPDPPDQQ